MKRGNLAAERARKGLTIAEVAETLGVHPNAVSRWENGTATPNGHNLTMLSALYKQSPEYLMEECEPVAR